MKSGSYFGIVLLVAAVLFVQPASAATIAHWNFEDGTAGLPFYNMPRRGSVDIVNGYVMRGYNTTYGPSFTAETPDGSGLGAYCNGSQDGYTTNSVINGWSPQAWTIEISARLDDISGWETLIGRDGASHGEPESDFYLQKNNVNGAFRINYESVGGQRWILDSNFTVQAGRWYHLAVTSDGAELTMYCDKLDGSGYQVVGSLDISSQTPAQNALAASGANWTFGRGWYNNSFTDHITGYFDNVRFSDTVLAPNEFLGYNPILLNESDGKTLLFKQDLVYTDDYSIVLKEAPAGDVTVTITPPAGLTVGNGSGQSLTITFTSADWNQPRTITVGVADAGALLADIEYIGHSVQSTDPKFNGVSIRDVAVYIEEDACGVWGYLETDYDFNCKVDLEDFAVLAGLWLITDAPLNLTDFATDWLMNTWTYNETTYARSIQRSDQPFFVNTANIANTIDEKIYGHFLEHIYHSVNGGLWGELVWNRSFEMSDSGGGIWSIEDNQLIQSSLSTDVRLPFGDTGWSDYELTLEARKDGGSEGFLIPFRYADGDNFYWLNLGGWGNVRHAVEKEINGSRSTVSGTTVNGSINTGQWYSIRIRCQGNTYSIYLDNVLIISFTDSSNPHLTGQVGVGTWATQARFRNIQVAQIPDSAILFSGLPDLPGTAFGAAFWSVFGTAQATMTTDALNDSYAVQIIGDGSAAGLMQNNFKFIPQKYNGSLWMKGSLPAGLKVELLDNTTVLGQAILPAPSADWAEYPFQIDSAGSTNQGMLRITLLGAGTVKIDQISLMGQDAASVGGYRPDLLSAVEGLRPPIIRWPGGCYASAYFWKDGIGPQHQRRKYPISLWDDQDTNSYGTDEFLRMCRRIGAEPLICVNTGLLNGTCGVAIPYKLTEEQYLQDVLDWMEYCNGSVDTPWGAVRAANGHPEPYNVTYWEIDNETWSTSWGGGITNYIAKVQLFAPAMRIKAEQLGVPVKLIACGSGSYDQSWNRTLIDNCAVLIDYISTHHYESPDNFKQGPRSYEAFINELAAYIAASANPDLKIYMSEWNAQSTDWRTGLYAGGLLNAFERTGDVFEIGGPALFLRHTSASGWDNAFINFDHTGWFAAPNYIVMKLWHDHYAPLCVQTNGTDTNLNVVSALSADEKTLYIRIVNPDADSKSVAFEIDPSFTAESAYMHYVAPGSLYARNTLANPQAVRVEAKVIGLDDQTLRFKMPGYAAAVVTVRTSKPHKTAFLYSSFRNNGEDGLHLAYSQDGLVFTALKGDTSFLAPQVGSRLMRDPSICQGPDGMFHLVWTTGWWDKGIGIAHSPDLINWSEQIFLPVMAHEPNAKNCWAPEIFYDEATDRFLIFWSTTIDGAFPETYNPSDDNNHRIYYVSTQDFVTYSNTALFYDPGFNCIDAFIAKHGAGYVMFLKNETKVPIAQKNIRMAFSDSAAGPWGPASESISPAWVEGPSAVKAGGQWYLYYDAYTRGRMEATASLDLKAWTDITSQLSFPAGTRHGTVFRVAQDIVDALKSL
ncbi:MAG: family 43 glycosylhydrolase [Phycisphaerae bacterium]|nr:family 43 glycosylhydrolase [Phycisphaerae bacterium]